MTDKNMTNPMSRADAVEMTLLGVDWGAARIGVAIKPAGQDWALPRGILTVRAEKDAIEALRREITEAGAQGVVVGLPLAPDGTDSVQSRAIKRFCRKARQSVTGVRWLFVDETLTTQAADELARETPGRRPTDDLAAKLILETFLSRLS